MLKTKRFICAFLAFAILLTPLPKKADATVLFPRIPSTETAAPEIPEAAILGEDTGKREKNIKHFLKEDMSFTAAVYPTAVHFKENGKWEDIDNSLVEGMDEASVPVLENKKNAY